MPIPNLAASLALGTLGQAVHRGRIVTVLGFLSFSYLGGYLDWPTDKSISNPRSGMAGRAGLKVGEYSEDHWHLKQKSGRVWSLQGLATAMAMGWI